MTRSSTDYSHINQQQINQKMMNAPIPPQPNPNVRANAPYLPPDKNMGDMNYTRTMPQHGGGSMHMPQNIQMPISNPNLIKQPPQNRTMMMNNPQVGQQYPSRYYQSQMMGGNMPNSTPSPMQHPPPNAPSPSGYSPMSNPSPPSRNSPQDPNTLTSSTGRRSFTKETKPKAAKPAPKKGRTKGEETTMITQKSPTQDNFGHRSPPLTPNQDPQFAQQGYQGYPMGWANNMKPQGVDNSVYSSYPNQEFLNDNSYQGSMPHRGSFSNGLDEIAVSNRKRKSSVLMDDMLEQSNDILDMNQDDSYLNDVGRDNQLIMSSSVSNSDFLANFENDNKNTSNYSISEWKTLHLGEESNRSKIVCCSFNNTGTLLATATSKMTINVWDVNSGKIKSKFTEPYNTSGLCFSPNPETPDILASCSMDGSIRIWDMASDSGYGKDQVIKMFKSKEHGAIHSVDFHPTKYNLLCSSETSSYLRFWDIEKDDNIHVVKDAAIKQARFSPTGNRIATGKENIVKVFDVETLKPLYVLSGHNKPIHSVYWGDNDLTLISASEDTVRVWRLGSNSSDCIGLFTPPGNKNYYAIPHPKYMNSQVLIGAYKSIYVWDYSQARMNQHYEIKAHDGIVSSLCSFGGSILASTSHDSEVKLWMTN